MIVNVRSRKGFKLTFDTGRAIPLPQVFENLVSHIAQQNIRPMVSQWFMLDDIAEVQQRFLEKGHVGKIVLAIPS
jgi:NADPH:quinone reductase-like Zn-dependent oxidoreductase